uniref:Transposase IS4-like domain-containing protein n=1 Tax=Cereibacter sphaeroides (strain ATCC 17025 / ATH 2.4.3) TaxID=349102 RepID=A4WSG9_CERS5
MANASYTTTRHVTRSWRWTHCSFSVRITRLRTGGMNTKLHAVADANSRPIGFFISAGPVSDYTGGAALLGSLPKADWLLADRGYDADWLRDASKDKGMKVCIPAGRPAGSRCDTTSGVRVL